MAADWIIITYKCLECGQIDHEKCWKGKPIPIVANCTSPSCRSGEGHPVGEMLTSGLGMRPLLSPEQQAGAAMEEAAKQLGSQADSFLSRGTERPA